MPYKCAFGCIVYNPLCDACDSDTTSEEAYEPQKDQDDRFKAATKGKTLKEYREEEQEE